MVCSRRMRSSLDFGRVSGKGSQEDHTFNQSTDLQHAIALTDFVPPRLNENDVEDL